MPPQLTTTSALTSPCSVATPVTRPSWVWIAVTLVSSKILAPPLRAPLARAVVVSIGLVWPSLGRKTPPTTSSVLISGQRRFISSVPMTSTSRPKVRAMEAPRFHSSKRSSVVATEMDPFCLKPVA